MIRFASERPRRPDAASDTGGDPIPAALGDSLWLGGEAMVAPGCVPPSGRTGCARAGEAADPDWCAL